MAKIRSVRTWARIAAEAAVAAVGICAAWAFGWLGFGASTTLDVALYNYLPDSARFEQAVRSSWEAEHPDVELNFVAWSSYTDDPPQDLDVFVFDSVYLQRFVSKGLLLPLGRDQIQDADDILPFALDACAVDGTTYALPQLLCVDLVYTRPEDEQLAEAGSVHELYDVIGEHTGDSVVQGTGEGLLADLSSRTSRACTYLQALLDEEGAYRQDFLLDEARELDSDALQSLLLLKDMGGSPEALDGDWEGEPCPHARLFAQGTGRAFVGHSEAMCSMGAYADEVDFHLFSLSGGRDVPVLYADFVGVNASVSSDKRQLAIELANVLASSEVLVAANRPSVEGENPQYLLPATKSAYERLAQEFDGYKRLERIAADPRNRVLLLRPDGRQLIESCKEALDAQGIGTSA